MGFESYQVRLHGGSATFTEADAAIRLDPRARPDRGFCPGPHYYTIEDGSHVLEVEVSPNPVSISCRFTLSHPPSIDAAFIEYVRELVARLGMAVEICDDVRPEHEGDFPIDRFPEFAGALPGYIARERSMWIATMGDEQLAASTREVHRRIILPQCVPVARQPS